MCKALEELMKDELEAKKDRGGRKSEKSVSMNLL